MTSLVPVRKSYWKIWLLLIILLPLSLIPASQPASGSQDYIATLTNIRSAMNALLTSTSGADLRCGHDGGFFIQNDEGCNTNADLSDKIWKVYGYSSLYVFGTNSGEKQNEFAFLSSMYTPQTVLSSAPVKVGTHSGLVTIEVYDGQLLTFLYWGNLNVFSVFHGATDLGDFDTLNADQKNQKIKTLFDQSVTYAQRLEDNLVQFHAYDATSAPPQEPTKHLPIIFIPGVAGSYLYNGGTQTWPRAGTDAKYMFLQKDGITPVDTTAQISATQMLSSKGAFNVYGGMENYLQTQNYTLNTDLFEFAYDWRLDNTKHLQELDQLVNSVLDKTHASKVILIAHSMGGLIARAYVNDMGASKVDTLITVGTPFYGAVKPYYALVNGYNFGNPFATQLSMKIMAQNAPAVYQLLPRIPFMQDLESSHDLTLDESNQIHYKGVQSGTIRYYETPENSWSLNPSLIQSANTFHNKLGAKENPVALPAGVKHYVIIGTGVSTLIGYDVLNAPQDKQFVELLNRHVWLVPQFEDGDGTVPLWSSQISGVTQTYYIPYKSEASSEHGSLTDNPDVQKIVGSILKASPADPSLYIYANSGVIRTDYTSFSLHSDAHLTIMDKQSGKSLGYNNQGEVDEGIGTGTFLAMDSGEYASIADVSNTYKVLVNGTGDGKFTLITNVTKSGQSTIFSYKDVPVQKGTIALFEITPSQISLSNMPTLQVSSGGQITSISPTSNLNTNQSPTTNYNIPSWIKKNAGWWSTNQISDDEYVKAIQFLIQMKIMKIPSTQSSSQQSQHIPSWVKSNAGWWSTNQVSDDEYVKGIQYLISGGIITLTNTTHPLSSTTTSTSNLLTTNPLSSRSALSSSVPLTSTSQSANGFFKMDKSQYMASANPPEMATISGKLNSPSGGAVIFTITYPDGTTEQVNAGVTNVGDFRTLIIMDTSFPAGTYTVSGNYHGSDLGSTKFIVK